MNIQSTLTFLHICLPISQVILPCNPTNILFKVSLKAISTQFHTISLLSHAWAIAIFMSDTDLLYTHMKQVFCYRYDTGHLCIHIWIRSFSTVLVHLVALCSNQSKLCLLQICTYISLQFCSFSLLVQMCIHFCTRTARHHICIRNEYFWLCINGACNG